MPFVYSNVDGLEGEAKVGTKHCVVLVQHYAHAPVTSQWKEGEAVVGNNSLMKGTAIATFVDGSYPNSSTGNHAALYISQDANGITVMDQWKSDTSKPTISSRYIRRRGKNAAGSYINPSNNADAFSVIEQK